MTLNNNGSTPPCDAGYFERLNYYFGKLLTVRDFKTEQNYLNEKRWLLNRKTVGWGTACGLKVIKDTDGQLKVTPGFALDKYGNEIIVCQPQVIDIPIDDNNTNIDQRRERDFFICIQYQWCFAEPSPSPVEECGDIHVECNYNRIRESFRLQAIEVGSELYENIKQQCEHPFVIMSQELQDCLQFVENPCRRIIEGCDTREPGLCLVLAKITVANGIIRDEIDNCTYRKIVLSNDELLQLGRCLKEELWKVHAARVDRRQFVPLLTHTIKGLEYRNGKILTISEISEQPATKHPVGKHPFSITTDGDCIWSTDQEKNDQNKGYIYKISKDGENVEPVEVHTATWGIAFDKTNIWVTHIAPVSGLGDVTVINASDKTIVKQINFEQSGIEVREIVFDGRYMWISHTNNHLSRVDTTDYTWKTYPDFAGHSEADISDMIFDGEYLWIGTDEDNGLRKVKVIDEIMKISEQIKIGGRNPKGLFFDGTHVWVGNDGGASKIDILSNSEIGFVEKGILTRLTFDGMYLWALQPSQHLAHRIGIFELNTIGETKVMIPNAPEIHQILRLCFDGIFIWVTAYVEENQVKKGVVYRLLI